MSGYPYATINAFNWMAALGGNWKGLEETVLLGITWQQLGWFNILLVTAGLAYFAVRSARGGSFSPLLLAAYYGIGVFTLAHCMHEALHGARRAADPAGRCALERYPPLRGWGWACR